MGIVLSEHSSQIMKASYLEENPSKELQNGNKKKKRAIQFSTFKTNKIQQRIGLDKSHD